ncbi:hypothetical protein RSOLAG1IB_09543 [Rhizoctonia solani AG-1 IB]|uniref:Uncharacterized protein n=1 Tax=Thanatephorus cucumeris (strain AG1-IB / isolate 7/3/14) TaxID=1108050 RepID=A0A0B7FTW1_THACB|nr:hypothetical protein RSOLAG1IB_09543 [Rhizoctonia solani AG-1 IB]
MLRLMAHGWYVISKARSLLGMKGGKKADPAGWTRRPIKIDQTQCYLPDMIKHTDVITSFCAPMQGWA